MWANNPVLIPLEPSQSSFAKRIAMTTTERVAAPETEWPWSSWRKSHPVSVKEKKQRATSHLIGESL